jgi:RHS repeat-associated protein
MEYDSATGLYYDHARYYDAAIGRFASQDPEGFAAGDTNLYRYVGNDPTAASDTSGEQESSGGGAQFPFTTLGPEPYPIGFPAPGPIGYPPGGVGGQNPPTFPPWVDPISPAPVPPISIRPVDGPYPVGGIGGLFGPTPGPNPFGPPPGGVYIPVGGLGPRPVGGRNPFSPQPERPPLESIIDNIVNRWKTAPLKIYPTQFHLFSPYHEAIHVEGQLKY